MKCADCGNEWPDRLVHRMASSDPATNGKALDPICALKSRNAMHGLPAATPFAGTGAAALHAEAVKWAKAHGIAVQA